MIKSTRIISQQHLMLPVAPGRYAAPSKTKKGDPNHLLGRIVTVSRTRTVVVLSPERPWGSGCDTPCLCTDNARARARARSWTCFGRWPMQRAVRTRATTTPSIQCTTGMPSTRASGGDERLSDDGAGRRLTPTRQPRRMGLVYCASATSRRCEHRLRLRLGQRRMHLHSFTPCRCGSGQRLASVCRLL